MTEPRSPEPSRELLVSLPHAPAPPHGEVLALEAPDGVRLRVARWMPAGSPRATVLLLHGFTEFIEKYYEVVGHLLDRDFAVVTHDHRGQGLSQRLLPDAHPARQGGYQTDFADLVAEAIFVHERLVVGDALPRPHLLMAHSMGGNVALRVLQDYPKRFDRAVLSAPMLGFDRIPLWLMNAVANLYVWLGQGERYAWGAGDADLENPVNRVTSDAARHARAMSFWRHEPELVTHGVTWRWIREATRSIATVARADRMRLIETPTLLASAGRDQVVSSTRHRDLAALNPKLQLVHLAESMHEILQESEAIQSQFWDAFDRFASEA